MKKWRIFEYRDEGCSLYQCLECKETWVSRTEGFPRCPYCGVVFEGQHKCRIHGSPKWMYGRGWEDPYVKRRYDTRKPMVWRIESCMFHKEGEPYAEEWEFEVEKVDAKEALVEYRKRVKWAQKENKEESIFGEKKEIRIKRMEAKWLSVA